MKIPICEPKLSGNELKYVTDCIRTNWISSLGSYIDKFEEKFKEFVGTKYAITCSNGTAALNLALASLGIRKGDEVIIPDFTMIAVPYSVIYTNAKPVLVDAEKETWNIDPKKIEEKITKKTKAIIAVHTYGHPVDMGPILSIADKYDLYVIEDCAEAHGALYKGKMVGSIGDVGCFSFYANKILTTGEGGMITTNNGEIDKKVRLLRNMAFTEPRFSHSELGFNYRMTNLQAAIGVAQMEKVEELIKDRMWVGKTYDALLDGVKCITRPPQKEWARNVYWLYSILIEKEFGVTRDEVKVKLKDKGIDTRNFFVPMHRQPLFQKKDERFPDTSGSYPISDELSRKGIQLPSGDNLKEEDIKRVVDTLVSLRR